MKALSDENSVRFFKPDKSFETKEKIVNKLLWWLLCNINSIGLMFLS